MCVHEGVFLALRRSENSLSFCRCPGFALKGKIGWHANARRSLEGRG